MNGPPEIKKEPRTRDFYRQVFAWLEIQKMNTSKPVRAIGFGTVAHSDYWRTWELHLLCMITVLKIPDELKDRHGLEKAQKLAELYDAKYLPDIREIMETAQAWLLRP